MHTPFQSERFTLHQLADGVYAAIATELGAVFSNARLVDLGEQILVFDAFENPIAAEDLWVALLNQLAEGKAKTFIPRHGPLSGMFK